MTRPCATWIRCMAGTATLACLAGAGPWFTGLGDLAGGSFESDALAIAADGSAIVGYSGARKSPPFEAAIKPIRHLQELEVAKWPKIWEGYEAEKLKWKAQVKKWTKDTGGVGSNPPAPDVL